MKNVVKTMLASAGLAVLGLGATPVMAQVGTTGNAVVTVTVTDVLALAVAIPAVPLIVATVDDYEKGTSFTAPAQLVASSNHPYTIKVQSDKELEAVLGTGSIPISNVLVQTAPTLSNAYSSQLPLSTSIQPLISNAPAAMVKAYDVKYSIAGKNPALYVSGGAYKATLTYSITAQ